MRVRPRRHRRGAGIVPRKREAGGTMSEEDSRGGGRMLMRRSGCVVSVIASIVLTLVINGLLYACSRG
jgi:hypothetical protein